jgi:hypothetical protein
MTTPQLRFDSISDQTRARWAKLLDSARRDLTPRMRQLIRIALDACDSVGPPKMQARLIGGGTSLWMLCPQADLAELLRCSDRTLRTEFERLSTLQALETEPHETIANLIGYRIDLAVLESLQESLTPELDEIIFQWLERQAEAASVTVSGVIADGVSVAVSGSVSGQISAPISAPISGHFSGGVSAPVSGQISALTDNDNDNHYLITSDDDHHDESSETTAVWDMTSQEPLSFREIRDFHAEAIAGKTVDGAVLSLRQRWVMFMRYWSDVKVTEPGPLSQADATELLALFIYWGRAKTNKSRGGAIRTWWGNRRSQPIIATVKASLIDEARRVMAAGLGTLQRPPQPASVPPRVPDSQRIKRLNLDEMKERILKAKAEAAQPCQ